MGEMGITPDVFWNMRPCDFGLMLRGYRKKQFYEYERGWLYNREIIATLCNVNRDSKSSPVRGYDIIRLSFDKPLVIPRLTDEEDQHIQKGLKAALASLPPDHPLRNLK